MELICGLMDHQVLQRNKKNVSETVIRGKSELAGKLHVKVVKNKNVVRGFDWKAVGAVRAGEFECMVSGIPVGGPYDVYLKIVSKGGVSSKEIKIKDVLVGDVWILGGQSNMEGCGLLQDAARPQAHVRAFYMDDRWAAAKDPIHNLFDAVDPVHPKLIGLAVRNETRGTGPGVAFGQAMAKRSGVPQGLICCAHGGTTMDQWNPDLKREEGNSLYGATVRRFIKNGQRVAGVVWYQGCSDATGGIVTAEYTQKMIRLAAMMRKDFGDGKLPFVMVQIATVFSVASRPGWDSIREQQRLLPKVIKNLAVVPAIDLALEDPIHIHGQDQQLLGNRLAEAAWTLMKGKNAQKPPIEFKKMEFYDVGHLVIEVIFNHVIGDLRSGGRAWGFTLTDNEGEVLPIIYRVDLEENRAVIHTSLMMSQIGLAAYLYYGYSPATYCNIVDQANRSLPALGPIKILLKRNTWHICKIFRSDIVPGKGTLENVSCPDMKDERLGWREQKFVFLFLDLHSEIEPLKDDRMVFFAHRFRCEEPMKLQIGLGYDGPVKAWLDGKEIYYDPHGTNPAVCGKGKIKLDAAARDYQLVICLSANYGNAWGLFLDITREDIPRRQAKEGEEEYKMPIPV